MRCSMSRRRASNSRGGSSVSTRTAPLRNGPCSTGPHGSVSRIRETAVTSIPSSAPSKSIARLRWASRSPRLEPIPTKALVRTAAMFAVLRRFGVVLALTALAFGAGSSSAWAATLTRDQARELRQFDSTLVVARPGAGPALRRAGGAKIATALPVWRLPSGAAVRVLPDLARDGLVADLSADHPLSTLAEPLEAEEWWIPVVRSNQAVPPGPGKPLTVSDTGGGMAHEAFATRAGTTVLNAHTTANQFEEHGTAVASVAAAPLNGLGLLGMYPQAALQVWDASPTGDGITAGDVIQGLDAAIRRGQGVVNLSLGSQVRNPVLDSMVAVTVSSGTLVVAAAGNSRQRGSPLEYPASLPHVLTVGAIDQGVAPASFSSGSPHVDLAAPGTSIRVAVPTTFHPPIFYDS